MSGRVILRQPPRGLGVPNPSPFCVKVEAWLRITGIGYEVRDAPLPMRGPKGKVPWIEDGGARIGDSGLIIAHLKRTRGVDPDAGLASAARARDQALTALLEERLYWYLVHDRWLGAGWPAVRAALFGAMPWPMRSLAPPVARHMVRRQLVAQGTGRHADGEIQAMARRDIDTLAELLGGDPYVHGAAPTTIDAVVYGFAVNLTAVRLDTPLTRHARTRAAMAEYVARVGRALFPELTPAV